MRFSNYYVNNVFVSYCNVSLVSEVGFYDGHRLQLLLDGRHGECGLRQLRTLVGTEAPLRGPAMVVVEARRVGPVVQRQSAAGQILAGGVRRRRRNVAVLVGRWRGHGAAEGVAGGAQAGLGRGQRWQVCLWGRRRMRREGRCRGAVLAVVVVLVVNVSPAGVIRGHSRVALQGPKSISNNTMT